MENLRSRLPGISLTAVSATLAVRLLAATLSFTASVIVARGLSVHGRAVLAVMVSVPAVVSVFTVFGMDNANARFAGTSHTAYRQIVRWSIAFALGAGSVPAGLWLLLGHFCPGVLLGMPFRLAALTTVMCPATLLTTLLGSAEIGRGRITTYNVATLLPTACYFGGVTAMLAAGSLTVTSCFLAALAGQLASAAMLLIAASIRVHADGAPLSARKFRGFAIRAYFPNLVHFGLQRLDVPLIQFLAGTSAVAMYAVAMPVTEGLLLLPTAITLVIFPQVTSGAVDERAVGRISRTLFVATGALGGAAAAVAPFLIPALYGRPYAGAVQVIWAMLPGVVLFSAGRSLQAYLTGTDRLRSVTIAIVGGAVVNIALLVVLTPWYGAVGAGAADSAGFLVFVALVISHFRRAAEFGRRRRVVRSRRRALSSLRDLGNGPRVSWTRSTLSHRSLLTVAALSAAVLAGCIPTASRSTVTAVGVAIAALTCMVIPNAGIYAIAAAVPLSQSAVGMSLVTPNRLAALLLTCLVGRFATGQRVAWPKPVGFLITTGVIGYLVAASAVMTGSTPLGPAHWQYLLLTCSPLLLLPLITGPGPVLDRALLVLCSGSTIIAVINTVQAGSALEANPGLSPTDSAVLAITQPGTANHNAVGALLVMAAAVLLARLRAARTRLTRLAVGVWVVVMAIGVAYSLSRAAYLAGIAVLVVYAVRRSLRPVLYWGVGAACLVPLVPAAITARFGSSMGGSNLDADSAVRLDLWSSALRMFDAHPIFGTGYLNFASQLPAYYHATGRYDPMFLQFQLLDFAHNTYLTVLSQTGLVGAVGVGSLAVLGVRRAWSGARAGNHTGEAALLAMVAAGVCSLFGEVLLLPALLAGLVLIILAAEPVPAADPMPTAGPVPAQRRTVTT